MFIELLAQILTWLSQNMFWNKKHDDKLLNFFIFI